MHNIFARAVFLFGGLPTPNVAFRLILLKKNLYLQVKRLIYLSKPFSYIFMFGHVLHERFHPSLSPTVISGRYQRFDVHPPRFFQ